MSKIGAAVLQISRHLGIGHAQVAAGHAQGKNEFFFSKFSKWLNSQSYMVKIEI